MWNHKKCCEVLLQGIGPIFKTSSHPDSFYAPSPLVTHEYICIPGLILDFVTITLMIWHVYVLTNDTIDQQHTAGLVSGVMILNEILNEA